MQNYHKLSKILKILNNILAFLLVLYLLVLCTNSLFYLFRFSYYDSIDIVKLLDYKSFVFNIYIITFISLLLLMGYYNHKKSYPIKKIISTIFNGMLFLPISVLMIYNFMFLGNLMISFYLIVIFIVVTFVINLITKRIDTLYSIAVGSNEVNKNRKGDKKCKDK